MGLIVVDSITIILRKNEHISLLISQTHGGQNTKVWWKNVSNTGGDEIIQIPAKHQPETCPKEKCC